MNEFTNFTKMSEFTVCPKRKRNLLRQTTSGLNFKIRAKVHNKRCWLFSKQGIGMLKF